MESITHRRGEGEGEGEGVVGGDGEGGAGSPPLPHGTGTAFAHPPTRRAWARSRSLHYARHLGWYVLLAVVLTLLQVTTGLWPLTLGLAVSTVLIVVPGHWWNCRHASANARRARLVLEHYPWQPCAVEVLPERDGAAEGDGRPSFRLTDPAVPGRTWRHSVPGPGREGSSIRALVHPRVLVAAVGSAGPVPAWFAGDPRFGGVLSPPGGGQPVLLRARGGRGLKGEGRQAPPERDLLAIRAGLLQYRDLPKRHPVRREREAQEAVAVMRGTPQAAPPGPSTPPTATALQRRSGLRNAVRALLGAAGAVCLPLGVGLLVWAVLPDSGGVGMRLVLAGSALVALAVALLCLVGAHVAGSVSRRARWAWAWPVSTVLFTVGVLVLWLGGLLD
ncbi:hypothetical protein SUDANB15_07076 [Streptomyces sp. enrichment culture]|uniref:hypothetical protein n=1 Tax=Streptomyces sp. enrichment culture TaxID=1795815 RepID=UPI003F573038